MSRCCGFVVDYNKSTTSWHVKILWICCTTFDLLWICCRYFDLLWICCGSVVQQAVQLQQMEFEHIVPIFVCLSVCNGVCLASFYLFWRYSGEWENGSLQVTVARIAVLTALHASRLTFFLRLKAVFIATATSIDKQLAALVGWVVVVAPEVGAASTSLRRLVADICLRYSIHCVLTLYRLRVSASAQCYSTFK